MKEALSCQVQEDYFLVLPDCVVYKYAYICKEYITLYLTLIEYRVKSWLRGERIGVGPEKNNEHNICPIGTYIPMVEERK